MADKWEWKVGVLQGIGEAVWQQCESRIRRITRVVATPQGMGLLKCPIAALAKGGDETESALRAIVLMYEPSEEIAEKAERLWSGGNIVVANGRIPT